jgi:hypothetical protein
MAMNKLVKTKKELHHEILGLKKQPAALRKSTLKDPEKIIPDKSNQAFANQQLAKEVAAKSEVRLFDTFNHRLKGNRIIGYNRTYLYPNKTAEIHNRRHKEELFGKCYMDMCPGIVETEVIQIMRKTLKTGIPSHFENDYIFSGSEPPLVCSSNASFRGRNFYYS